MVGYLGDRIRSHFGNGYRWGLDISYVEQGSVPGTGAAALLAEAFVEEHPFFLRVGRYPCGGGRIQAPVFSLCRGIIRGRYAS